FGGLAIVVIVPETHYRSNRTSPYALSEIPRCALIHILFVNVPSAQNDFPHISRRVKLSIKELCERKTLLFSSRFLSYENQIAALSKGKATAGTSRPYVRFIRRTCRAWRACPFKTPVFFDSAHNNLVLFANYRGRISGKGRHAGQKYNKTH